MNQIVAVPKLFKLDIQFQCFIYRGYKNRHKVLFINKTKSHKFSSCFARTNQERASVRIHTALSSPCLLSVLITSVQDCFLAPM